MKPPSTLDRRVARLPIGYAVEICAFLALAAALAALSGLFTPARAQAPMSDETARHVASMAAIEKQAEAQIEMAKTLRVFAERFSGAPAAAAAPLVNPAAKTCDGFGSCLLGVFKATTEGVRDVVSAVAPIAAPYYAYKGSIIAAETARVVAQEGTKQEAARQVTTQAGFQTAAQIAASGTAGLVAVATQPAPPSTAVTVTGNTGPVQVGSGSVVSGSNNPSNPAPVVCVPGTTGTNCSRGP